MQTFIKRYASASKFILDHHLYNLFKTSRKYIDTDKLYRRLMLNVSNIKCIWFYLRVSVQRHDKFRAHRDTLSRRDAPR